MALTHGDVLKIQTAIDAYEKKFPEKPSPSAAEALAWQASKRGAARAPDNKAQAKAGRHAVVIAKSIGGHGKLLLLRWLAALHIFKRSSAIS